MRVYHFMETSDRTVGNIIFQKVILQFRNPIGRVGKYVMFQDIISNSGKHGPVCMNSLCMRQYQHTPCSQDNTHLQEALSF